MAARDVEQGSMARALFERLQTSERGIRQMAAGVREVAALEDPLGRELTMTHPYPVLRVSDSFLLQNNLREVLFRKPAWETS